MNAAETLSVFDKWWIEIEPLVMDKSANVWQNLYKEIYLNILKDDRWLQYLKGLGVTLRVSFFAILVGLALGTLLAILRLPQMQNASGRGKGFFAQLGAFMLRSLSKLAGGYINLIRGTPLLLQVLIINFGIFGTVRIDKVIIGVIACGLNSAAYVAEIVRGGIMSVEKGQTEAGRSLGLSSFSTMIHIILPQAAKSALPAMCNEFISLIKETSILSYVGIVEITRQGILWASRDFKAFPAYIGVAVVYMCMTIPLSRGVEYLEKRMAGTNGAKQKRRKAGM